MDAMFAEIVNGLLSLMCILIGAAFMLGGFFVALLIRFVSSTSWTTKGDRLGFIVSICVLVAGLALIIISSVRL